MQIHFYTYPQYKKTDNKKYITPVFRGVVSTPIYDDVLYTQNAKHIPKKDVFRPKPLSKKELEQVKTKLYSHDKFSTLVYANESIESILGHINTSNKDCLDLLLKSDKIECGTSVEKIFIKVTSENKELLPFLLSHKKVKSSYIIADILKNTSEANKDAVKTLLNHKRIKYEGDVATIIPYVDKDNQNVLPVLLNVKKNKNLAMDIISILNVVNSANNKFVKTLFNHDKMRDIAENNRINILHSILEGIKKENNDLFEYVLNHKKTDINGILHIIFHLNAENKDILKTLLDDDKMTAKNTGHILFYTNEINKEFIPLLLSNKKIEGENIFKIMAYLNAENKDQLVYILNHDKVKTGKDVVLGLRNLTAENKSILKDLLENENIKTASLCSSILKDTNNQNKDIVISLVNYAKDLSNTIWFTNIQRMITKDNQNILLQLILNPKKQRSLEEIENIMKDWKNPNLAYITKDKNIEKLLDKAEHQRQIMLKAPELYVNENNGYNHLKPETRIISFINSNLSNLYLVSTIFDKETLNNFFRLRIRNVSEYFHILNAFEEHEVEKLYKMNRCVNIDGKTFTPTQKIQFIDLINAYKNSKLDQTIIDEMIASGKIDIEKLNLNLFRKIMIKLGLSEDIVESIPLEKLREWDTKYVHLLAEEVDDYYNYEDIFSQILRVGICEPNLKKCLMDTNYEWGEFNLETQQAFENLGMDFEKWLTPSKENEVKFILKDENKEKLNQIASKIIEDINELRRGREKFIDKQIRQFIDNGKFVIPKRALTSNSQLSGFINTLIKQLKPIWDLAQKNETNLDKNIVLKSNNTLTILSHLYQRLEDIAKINTNDTTQNINWTIKMWDRVLQKDLFQGNYSSCCIGMGRGNGHAMPSYLTHTAFNMIEFVDNETGKTVGNALCYLVKNENDEPALIIDNIEINNACRLSDEAGIKLREKLVEYASKLMKEITLKDDIKIFLGGRYNDVSIKDLLEYEQKNSFIGSLFCDEIYLDTHRGWVWKSDLDKTMVLLKLR